MADDVLRAEAKAWLRDYYGSVKDYHGPLDTTTLVEGYIAAAKPRDERIAELERLTKWDADVALKDQGRIERLRAVARAADAVLNLYQPHGAPFDGIVTGQLRDALDALQEGDL